MPSYAKCRQSARLSAIARQVYGAERVRPYPAVLLPTYPPAPPSDGRVMRPPARRLPQPGQRR